jgi:carbon storage regulator
MLVLTRKVGEKILIGDDIIISVVEIDRSGVRIGVEAPKQLSILRYEVYERIREENLTASRATPAMDIRQAAAMFRRQGAAPETTEKKQP